MSFNKIIIVGNLGKDVDLSYTKSDMAVGKFSVATNESVKDKNGEWQKVATWFNCVVWGKQAENAAKFLSKGSLVYIEGRLKEEKWEDRDGNDRTSLVINVNEVQFLDGKKADSESESSSSKKPKSKGESESSQEIEDDEIPF